MGSAVGSAVGSTVGSLVGSAVGSTACCAASKLTDSGSGVFLASPPEPEAYHRGRMSGCSASMNSPGKDPENTRSPSRYSRPAKSGVPVTVTRWPSRLSCT